MFKKFSQHQLIKDHVYTQLKNDRKVDFFWDKAFTHYQNTPEVDKIFTDRLINSDKHYEKIIEIRFKYANAIQKLIEIIKR